MRVMSRAGLDDTATNCSLSHSFMAMTDLPDPDPSQEERRMTNRLLFGPELDPSQKERRYRRWGGFVLSPETAASWALRASGRELYPIRNNFDICDVLKNEVRPHRAGFSVIGEELEDVQYMIVTQSAKFNGYRGMDPNEIPQFKEGEREAIGQQLLEKAGVSFSKLGIVISETPQESRNLNSERVFVD